VRTSRYQIGRAEDQSPKRCQPDARCSTGDLTLRLVLAAVSHSYQPWITREVEDLQRRIGVEGGPASSPRGRAVRR